MKQIRFSDPESPQSQLWGFSVNQVKQAYDQTSPDLTLQALLKLAIYFSGVIVPEFDFNPLLDYSQASRARRNQ